MIFAPLFHLLTALLNSLYASLPPWTFSFNGPVGGSSSIGGGGGDTGAVETFIFFLSAFDRFIPIHDCLVPIVSTQITITIAMLAFKAVKFILSLVPTISAGG